MSVEKFIISKESSPYTIIPNNVLQGLHNAEALGLWCYLSSLPPNWEVYKSELRKHFSMGEKKMDKLISFLQKCCLIKIEYGRKTNGEFTTSCMTILNGENFKIPNEIKDILPHRNLRRSVNGGTVKRSYKYNINKNNIKQIKHNTKQPTDFYFVKPDWLDQKDWEDFLEHRKTMKAPMSVIAQKRLITKLTELKDQGEDVSKVLNESIVNGWKGVFSLKNTQGGISNGQRKESSAERYSRISAAAFRRAEEEDARRAERPEKDITPTFGQNAQSFPGDEFYLFAEMDKPNNA